MAGTKIAEFFVELGVDDEDAKALGDITEELKQMKRKADDASKSGKKLETLGKAGRKIAKGFVIAGAAIGAMFTGLALGAKKAFGFLDETTQHLDTIAKEARVAGLSGKEFQELSFAAERSGASTEQLSMAVRFLGKNLLEAEAGGAALFREGMDTLGLTLKDFEGLSTTDQIGLIGDALQQVENPANRTALAARFLGEEAGPKMASLLAEGTDGIRNLASQAVVASDESLATAEAFQDSMTNIKAAIFGVTSDLVGSFGPGVSQMIDLFRDWISENRELIQLKIGEFIQGASVVFERFWTIIQALEPAVRALVQGLFEAVDVLTALGAENAANINLQAIAEGLAWVIGLATDLVKIFAETIGFIVRLGKTIFLLTKQFFELAGSNETVKEAIEAIKPAIESVVNFVERMISKISDFFSELYDQTIGFFDFIEKEDQEIRRKRRSAPATNQAPATGGFSNEDGTIVEESSFEDPAPISIAPAANTSFETIDTAPKRKRFNRKISGKLKTAPKGGKKEKDKDVKVATLDQFLRAQSSKDLGIGNTSKQIKDVKPSVAVFNIDVALTLNQRIDGKKATASDIAKEVQKETQKEFQRQLNKALPSLTGNVLK